MGENQGRKRAIDELTTALDTGDVEKKDFHIRQALQLLQLNEEGDDSPVEK